jgi:putative ABC transport system permease protein
MFQNLRHAIRLLYKNPDVTTAALATLAIGIGATTAIFSVAYTVLLKPLPYDHAEQLVSLRELNATSQPVNFTDPNFDDIRSESHSLEGAAEFHSWLESVSGGAEPVRVGVAPVSKDFFKIMRVQPVLGRGFAPEEQHFGGVPVALVAHSFWKQFLGSQTDFSRVKLTILSQSVSVIGVLPSGFDFPLNSQVWVPRELFERYPSRTAHNWQVIARLRDGASIAEARAELGAIARQIHQQYAPDVDMTDALVVRLQDELARPVRPALMVLLASVGFLLLVACLNVANLLLVERASRQKEFSIRLALGAKPAQLLRQFLIEALLLSLCGSALGVLAARVAVTGLLRLAPAELENLRGISVDPPVLLFAFALMAAITIGLGVFSARSAIRSASQRDLSSATCSRLPGGSSHRAANLIVIGQLALTLILLTGAGLLGRSLLRVLSVSPGFRTEQVLTVDFSLPNVSQPEDKPRRVAFLDNLISGLRLIPGVTDAGGTGYLPLVAGDHPDGTYIVLSSGQAPPRSMDELDPLFHGPNTGYAAYTVASEGFFTSLDIPLLRGRLFDQRDSLDSPPVALISESLAHEKWPGQEPLGRSIEFGNMDGDLRPLTVIGVVGDVHASSLEENPQPTIYVSLRQRPQAASHFAAVIRSTAEPAALIPAARQLVRNLDLGVAPEFGSFAALRSSSLRARRFNLILVGFFAAAALLLAVVGLYGVMAHRVVRRTGEIGVRIALGATRANILRLVLAQGARVTAVGVALGIAGSLALTRAIRSLLFGLSPADPATFAAVALLLIAVALLACYLPARRAARVDPNVALRYE